MKKILDSVHGYINIDEDYCKDVIDTEYFQRLRRIEQTSTRSIFPSARHDRFIHSLGVFHLGCKIICSLKDKSVGLQANDQLNNLETIYESYKLACLLHDVGHAPFSHTFEEFYDNQWSDLRNVLCVLVNVEQFTKDWNAVADPSAPHEKMSAIIAIGIFGGFIEKKNADKELVARMIIGLKYTDEINHSFANAMIDLIHGDVVDADGLDYVCRDVWASGYSTTKVDVERLIDSINIVKDENGKYGLCFSTKCLNEIESVLKVKTFQQLYVINHHTVTYEQALLIEAMRSAAVFHFYGEKDVIDSQKRKEALEKLCNIKCLYDNECIGINTDKTKINIKLPMDDDFISLMKYIRNDKYVHQWLSRKYDLIALWKSKAEFYQNFDNLRNTILTRNNWIFHYDCKSFIARKFNISINDIWIKRATPKYKDNYAKKVKLYVKNKIIDYQTLFPADIHSYEPPQDEFYYIYVPKTVNKDDVLKALKEEVAKYYINIGRN